MGGYLPKIAEIVYNLQQVILQECYIESDIPDCSIAYAHSRENKFLIHKSFAQILIEEKAISPSDLTPAMIVKELPRGYTLDCTVMPDRPTISCMQKSIAEYEKLKRTERPLRLISEKDALTS